MTLHGHPVKNLCPTFKLWLSVSNRKSNTFYPYMLCKKKILVQTNRREDLLHLDKISAPDNFTSKQLFDDFKYYCLTLLKVSSSVFVNRQFFARKSCERGENRHKKFDK
jgi:hypothetical protein